MTKTEFPEGFFEKPRPHATNLYIAKEHETEDGGWIEPITKLVLCRDCKYAKCIEQNDDWWECSPDKRVIHGDDYCSWSVRKQNETD